MTPGSIVRCRNRDWVLLPSDTDEVYRLRPLAGSADAVVAVSKILADLVGGSLPEERVRPAHFPLPTIEDLADATSAHLLWETARLTLRDGATPFRSLGRLSIRPRVYQFVPLLMALRLDPVRLLIADDVGVGKTIEALMIARELLDRGEIRRLVVLSPPYLCDQWRRALAEKAALEAVVIRSATVGQLDRHKASDESIYRAYPIQVASIDFLKTERNRHLFLQDCPEFVIVDEAHGAAEVEDRASGEQWRHRLLVDLAKKPDRHLVLLTATPHSGVETAFRSLLALLRPEFGAWDTRALAPEQRVALARHFVQRTRADIERDWDGARCFPRREPLDRTYHLSPAYLDLFRKTYAFCSEIITTGETLGKRQQRVRYWAALALLRAVMSSPASAAAAITKRTLAEADDADDPDFAPMIFESLDGQMEDTEPTPPIAAADRTLPESARRTLGELKRLAEALGQKKDDAKLAGAVALVSDLLQAGFSPILWCRYIATASYLAVGLREALHQRFARVQVTAISSRDGDDDARRAKLAEITTDAPRVLVATDCLSEGIDLQDQFNAVVHYDLPWNPNRLEQREGRVDRYGQASETVKTVRYFSPDSAIDGIVLRVLLDKAQAIHKALGIRVPVPEESDSVTEALLKALFLRNHRADADPRQLDLGFEVQPKIAALHARWEHDAERERRNRTRFAQRALHPEEVRAELEATDAVLGDPSAVAGFVREAARRLGIPIRPDKAPDTYGIAVAPGVRVNLPEALRPLLPDRKSGTWRVSFVSPTPEGAEYLGRNHPFVAGLASFLMEEALAAPGAAHASRTGVMRTRAVSRATTLILLRVRYLLRQPDRAPLLSEEVLVKGFTAGDHDALHPLADDAALALLANAEPSANVPAAEKAELASAALAAWPAIEEALVAPIEARAQALAERHRNLRRTLDLRVGGLAFTPELPPDLLGVLVLQPELTP